ncbi:PepSY domain-containing protein [Methylophilus methylotrophus]|uniref:PepSY domain-containing protein n=1 Tax=Methylophilus methylotrophus TaxID=17 RepID=UPI00036F259F|nr:PepSY domain-containing protein [Methylophilus methylotrophus]
MSTLIHKPANLFIITLLCGVMMSQPAWADDDDDPAKIAEMAKAFGLISLEEAQTKALAAKPGVVKEVELERRKFRSGWDYEVEIVDSNGAEWEVTIDAKTGKVNSVNRDWF